MSEPMRDEVRSPRKYGPKWDADFPSEKDARKYIKETQDEYYLCSLIAVETRRFEVREKEGL